MQNFDNIEKVIAVVVTYNRKELLMECIDAVLAQSYSINKLILIDNCSTDGTEDVLKNKGYLNNSTIIYEKLESNIGGAGGFYTGMNKAKEFAYDWIWIMDDDTIPNNDCLERLIEAKQCLSQDEKVSFLASSVYGPNGEFMNVPRVNAKKADNGYQGWYKHLDKNMISIDMATFVSILVNKDAIKRCGLPCKDFFLWGDDSEYTIRLTKYYGYAYMVGRSIAIHKRVVAKPVTLQYEEEPKRIDLIHYKYRNNAIIKRYYEPKYHTYLMFCISVLASVRFIFTKHGVRKIKTIIKGNMESLTQYRKFKEYIDGQIKEKRNE